MSYICCKDMRDIKNDQIVVDTIIKFRRVIKQKAAEGCEDAIGIVKAYTKWRKIQKAGESTEISFKILKARFLEWREEVENEIFSELEKASIMKTDCKGRVHDCRGKFIKHRQP